MSTGSSNVKCPQCGDVEAYSESDSHSLRFYVTCFECGYHYESKPTIDVNNKWLKDEEGKLIMEEKESKGYGAMRIALKKGGGQVGCFDKPVSDKDISSWIEHFAINPKTIDSENCYVTKWNEETKKVEYIFGKPKSVEEIKKAELAYEAEKEFFKKEFERVETRSINKKEQDEGKLLQPTEF